MENGNASVSAYCTTREAAKLLGVSVRTAQLWSESGLLEAWRTEGGHRRITRASVQRLLTSDARPALPPASTPPALERFKILVVEDDSVLLKLYRTVIAQWKLPVEVITASNGVEGLIRVGRDAPDLMITDLAMPGMDGFQLIRHLATSSFREGMEIVVVTGLEQHDLAARGGLPEGIRVYPKPIPFDDLRNIVADLLARRVAYLEA